MLYVYGVISLFASNLILLSVILYMVYNRGQAAQTAQTEQGAKAQARLNALASELMAEITEARRSGAELRKRALEYAANEARILDKQSAFDGIIKNAQRIVKELGASAGTLRHDEVYAKAMNMAGSGMPLNEISRQFGLLNGEAELISSINRLRNN